MRVAIMTDSYRPTVDGVATAVVVTRAALEALGHTVFVIAPDPGPEFREEGVYYFKARTLKSYPGYYVPKLMSRGATKLIRELHPDIIHVRGVAVMAVKAMLASHNTGVPTVLTYDTLVTDVIGIYSPVRLPKSWLVKLSSIYLRQLLKRPNAILVPTPSAGREVTENLKAVPRRLEVVPTGIDTGRFTRNPEGGRKIREKYGVPADAKVVITVGRVSYEKNVELILKSLPRLPEGTILMVVGEGPALEDLKKLAHDLNIEDKVVFTGYQKGQDLVDCYSCADCFVSASVFETQGFTVQEAMSCGLPAACGNGRAFTDFVHDGENGYLFNLTEEECAAAIIKALNAPPEVRAAGKATAESYGIRPTTERLVSVYQSVIDSKKEEKA